MTKDTAGIGLPDFHNGVLDRASSFLEDSSGEQDVPAPRLFPIEVRQVATTFGEFAGEKRADGAVRRCRQTHSQSSSGVWCFPRSTKSRRNGSMFTAPTVVGVVSKIRRSRASGS